MRRNCRFWWGGGGLMGWWEEWNGISAVSFVSISLIKSLSFHLVLYKSSILIQSLVSLLTPFRPPTIAPQWKVSGYFILMSSWVSTLTHTDLFLPVIHSYRMFIPAQVNQWSIGWLSICLSLLKISHRAPSPCLWILQWPHQKHKTRLIQLGEEEVPSQLLSCDLTDYSSSHITINSPWIICSTSQHQGVVYNNTIISMSVGCG